MDLNTSPTCFEGPRARKTAFRCCFCSKIVGSTRPNKDMPPPCPHVLKQLTGQGTVAISHSPRALSIIFEYMGQLLAKYAGWLQGALLGHLQLNRNSWENAAFPENNKLFTAESVLYQPNTAFCPWEPGALWGPWGRYDSIIHNPHTSSGGMTFFATLSMCVCSERTGF